MRRILVRIQGASASAYFWICAGGCNAVDGPKDKQNGGYIFGRGPEIRTQPSMIIKNIRSDGGQVGAPGHLHGPLERALQSLHLQPHPQ